MRILISIVVAISVLINGLVVSSNVLAGEWTDGGCGESAASAATAPPAAVQEDEEMDYVVYMEEEEPSADGSVSVFW